MQKIKNKIIINQLKEILVKFRNLCTVLSVGIMIGLLKNQIMLYWSTMIKTYLNLSLMTNVMLTKLKCKIKLLKW